MSLEYSKLIKDDVLLLLMKFGFFCNSVILSREILSIALKLIFKMIFCFLESRHLESVEVGTPKCLLFFYL